MNDAFSKIISDEQLIKALVIYDMNFLNVTPTSQQKAILDNPAILIRQQIFPYKKVTLATDNAKPYITSAWVNFKKQGMTYKSGIVYFYIICPVAYERTYMGIRYQFIADRLESIFSEGNNSNIGKFMFYDRGDFDVLVDGYLGHYIAFSVQDFDIRVSDTSA
jgi:hypothetical protein